MDYETKPLRSSDRKSYNNDIDFWVKTEFYCTDCGKQDIWQRSDETYGDYYHECNVVCHSCENVICCMPSIINDYFKSLKKTGEA